MNTTKEKREYTFYAWSCPDCGEEMRNTDRPKTKADLLCYACHLNAGRAKFFAEHAALVSGKIVAVLWNNNFGFIGVKVRDSDGALWEIGGGLSCRLKRVEQ